MKESMEDLRMYRDAVSGNREGYKKKVLGVLKFMF